MIASHGLPFIPPGFHTVGLQGQQTLAAQSFTLSVQHVPECRHSTTDITYTLDTTAFQERSRRQGSLTHTKKDTTAFSAPTRFPPPP